MVSVLLEYYHFSHPLDHETRQQAQTALRQIRQKEDRNAWLLIKQLH